MKNLKKKLKKMHKILSIQKKTKKNQYQECYEGKKDRQQKYALKLLVRAKTENITEIVLKEEGKKEKICNELLQRSP